MSVIHRIHLQDETVINDAVRLHKFAFIDLYHQEFKYSVREAEYAWHKCRSSRSGQLLALAIGLEPMSPERARALAAAIPRPPKPLVSVDWCKGDVITFRDRYGRELTLPIIRVFIHTDDKEYAQYRNERGAKSQVLVNKATLVSRAERVATQEEVLVPLTL